MKHFNPAYGNGGIKINEIIGNKAFINFLSNKNQTIYDKGLMNAIRAMIGKEFEEEYPIVKYQDMIVVHLKFMQPNMLIVDKKYTVSDFIAGFGGKFGIFAQLTGWSFLGILNILILIIKIIVSQTY